MPLTIYSKEKIWFEPHMQRFLELFHWKVMFCNSTETHSNSPNKNIFRCIPVILCKSNCFIILIFKIPFLLISATSCCSQIERYDKLVIKVAPLLHVWFIWVCWATLVTILAFLVPYLLKFCYFHSAIFATAHSLASLCFLRLYW